MRSRACLIYSHMPKEMQVSSSGVGSSPQPRNGTFGCGPLRNRKLKMKMGSVSSSRPVPSAVPLYCDRGSRRASRTLTGRPRASRGEAPSSPLLDFLLFDLFEQRLESTRPRREVEVLWIVVGARITRAASGRHVNMANACGLSMGCGRRAEAQPRRSRSDGRRPSAKPVEDAHPWTTTGFHPDV